MAALADRHYSRRTPGARQFCYSGRKIVLRDTPGSVLFVWMFPDVALRMDRQEGYNCAIFRNESARLSSSIILEAEAFAVQRWGPGRAYTFIDPKKLHVSKRRGAEFCHWPPGRCYIEAGWKPAGLTKSRKYILEKNLLA